MNIMPTRSAIADKLKQQIKPISANMLIGQADLAIIITCDEIKETLKLGGMLVDVRSPKEFSSSKIHHARNVPLVHLIRTSAQWDKNVPILLYCSDGATAQLGKEKLEDAGFKHVSNIGGTLDYPRCS